MLLEPWHDLDEVAGLVAVVELLLQNQIPAVATGSRRAWQAEDIFSLGHASRRPRLNGRGADLSEGQVMKSDGEALDLLFEQGPHGFDGDVETSETGAAR